MNKVVSEEALEEDIATFFSDDMNLVTIYLDNINLVDDNFDDDDPETIIHVATMTWCNRFKQGKRM